MSKVAFADSFHINKRNFTSLHDFLEKAKITPHVLLENMDEETRLISCHGNYADIDEIASPLIARNIRYSIDAIAHLDISQLYKCSTNGIELWPLCRSELLCYLLTLENWQTQMMRKDDRAIFEKAFAENHDALILNLAVAQYWWEYWSHRRFELLKQHYCCVYSGSMIYARTLLELLRRGPTVAIVMESLFTGNDFFFEERYRPIANNAGVKRRNTRRQQRQRNGSGTEFLQSDLAAAQGKIFASQNKNVVQPARSTLPMFTSNRPQVLIVGQVANDYSLIEQGYPYVNTIPVYIQMINELLDRTDFNVVFKAHPWENKKVHLKTPKTFETLAAFVTTLPLKKRKRILLVEDVNIGQLIETTQYFITNCSQAGIEAALQGLRPFVLGNAFYSDAGFTSTSEDISSLVDAVSHEHGTLNLDEYRRFEEFIVDLFQYCSVSVLPAGEEKIGHVLANPAKLQAYQPIELASELTSGVTTHPATSKEWTGVFKRKKPITNKGTMLELTEVEVTLLNMPKSVTVGQTFKVNLNAINNSDYILPVKLGAHQLQYSYHIYTKEGARHTWNGQRSQITQEIEHQQSSYLTIKAPAEPGEYIIVPGIVVSAVRWFDSKNAWEFSVE